jgi:hypothetical protein
MEHVYVLGLNGACVCAGIEWDNVFCAVVNPLTPELNPSAQRCMTRFFTGDFAS